jgi:hypothetical protein
MTYGLTMILSKVSIAWFLLRLTACRVHVIIIYVAMAIAASSCLAFIMTTLFQCHPVSAFWTRPYQLGRCIGVENIILLAYVYSACSVATDLTLALLPAWIICRLNISYKSKAASIPLLAMGCMCVFCLLAFRFSFVFISILTGA